MDLSILKTVNKPETIAPEEYVAPTDFSEPISVVGDYAVRVIDGKFKDKETNTEDAFRLSKTRNGDLQAEVALEVIGDGPYKGKRLYDRINLATFKNGNANTWFNFLMAFGNQVALGDPADYVQALEKAITKQRTAKVFVSLEWYSNPKATDYQGTGNSYKYKDASGNGWIAADGIRIKEPGTENILLGRNTMSKYRALNSGQQV